MSLFEFNSPTLKIESSEFSSVKTHSLVATVKYDGDEYTKFATLPFSVEVSDPCVDVDLTIGEGIISSTNLEYAIYSGQKIEPLSLSAIT